MIALGSLLCFALALFFVGLVWQKKRSVPLTAFTVVLFLLLLATWDNIIGNIVFDRLCKEESGEKIYRTVEDVEGVMMDDPTGCSGICIEAILGKRYRFIEVHVATPTKNSLTTYVGLHRFHLDKRGSADCKMYEELYEEREKSNDPFLKQFPYEYCIASKQVDKIKSSYIYSNFSRNVDYLPAWNISKTETNVKDIKTGEILGTFKQFYYYGGWVARKFQIWGPPMTPNGARCPKDKSSERWNLIYKVLKPKE